MSNYEQLQQMLASGAISRREFIGRVAALGIAASATSLFSTPAQAAPKRGGHFRLGQGHGQTTDSLDPATFTNGFNQSLTYAMNGYLTEVGADGTVQPGVAESWEASPDAKVWRFKLRKGVTFHSGRALKIDDVIASINYHRGEKSTSAAKPLLKSVDDVRALDPHTLEISLSSGSADFPFIVTDYHLPIMPASGNSIDWKSGDGCGVYKMEKYEPGVGAQAKRFNGHWDSNRGWFDSIEILVITDVNARTTALIAGDVDAIDRVDLKTVSMLKRRNGVKVSSVAGNQHYTFAMSTNRSPYDNLHVRQALKLGVKRQEMVDKILLGNGVVGNDHPIGRGQRYFNKDLAQTSYDPDKAKWHLKQAGMDSLSIDLSAADAAFAGAVDAAVLFQASAKAAGINIKVVREPNDGYWSDVWMKKPFTAVYWGGRPTEDLMFTIAYQTGAAWNDTFWSNKRFDKLLIEARAELDEDKRRAMYYEMQKIVNEDGGAIIPMFANYVFATNDKVGHAPTFGSNMDLDGERWAERWWFA
jgi:peptide/nickel transport system substrate-binding protein